MKTMLQAFFASIFIHIIYIGGMILVGFIKTKNYQPDIAGAWENVEMLQNEVAIGYVYSPIIYLFSIIGLTVICGIIILLYKNFFKFNRGVR
ncbi:membrane protein [Paucisalibacillus sp. EB02]|uniref:membrane protein n=1 Tax=Paucisalibacillus sp. EB02 TaxID=1347087 RepID=UPI0005A62867|nr:membrane protein [Paucisalibacillus sp. EB02]